MFRRSPVTALRAALVGMGLMSGCIEQGAPDDRARRLDQANFAQRESSTHGKGMPFGPFHLPDSLFGRPYSSTVRGARNGEEAVATLEAARVAKAAVVLRLARGSSRFSNPDSSFSLALWKREVDRYRDVDFAQYVADGTLLGHLLFDEPHDPSNWNGVVVAYADIEAAAAYSRKLWPTLPTGIGSPPAALKELRGNARRGALDFAFAQYRPKKGKLHAWRDEQVRTASELGYGLILSIQALEGNAGQPLTAVQLLTSGSVLAGDPYACMLSMWKWDKGDPRYFERADIRNAVDRIAIVARQNHARSCDPRAEEHRAQSPREVQAVDDTRPQAHPPLSDH